MAFGELNVRTTGAYTDAALQQLQASSRSTNQSSSGAPAGQADTQAVQGVRRSLGFTGHNDFRPDVYNVTQGYVS